MSPSIEQLCRLPTATRAAARRGEPTPCHRCLAYLPLTASGCFMIETRSEVRHPDWRPPDDSEQRELFPTPDTMVGDKENRS